MAQNENDLAFVARHTLGVTQQVNVNAPRFSFLK